MKRYFLTCLIIFYSLIALPQNYGGETKILLTLKSTKAIDSLNDLSYDYILSQKKDSAKFFSSWALKQANSINYAHGIAVALSNQAYIAMYFDNDYVEEEKLATESINWFNKTDNKEGLDDAGIHLSEAWYGQSKFDKSLEADTKYYLAAEKEWKLCRNY